jgi:protein involved in polysaccharide export with SLBB domain
MLQHLRVFSVALLAALVICPAPGSAQTLPVVPQEIPELRIDGVQPGDHVTLTLFDKTGKKLTDIGGQRSVDARGLLYLPFLEQVSVQGLSQDEVRVKLDAGYEAFYDDSVVEVVVEYRVNITGAVRAPGTYFLPPSSNLTDLISEGGGTQSEVDIGLQGGAADARFVRLTRPGYERPIIINFRPAEANSDVVNAPLQSGDWIHVPSARRSQLRDDIQFIGGILSVLLATASLIVVIGN